MSKILVPENMICPITGKHCDDECCTVGAECNVSGGSGTIGEITPYNEHYLLVTPVSVYGMFFPAGTEYRQVSGDWWHPVTKYGALLPSYAVHFMVIRNNEQYFKRK